MLVLLLAVFLNFGYFPWKQKQQVTEAMTDRAESTTQMLAAGVSLALEEGDFAFIDELFQQAKEDESILYIAIFGEDGKATVSFNPQDIDLPSIDLFSAGDTVEKVGRLHARSPLQISAIESDLIVGFSLRERDRAIESIRATGFVVSFAILVSGVLLSIYLSRLITTPLSRLVETIGEIGRAEDYEKEIQKTGNDEVGQLIDAFSAMIAQLRARSIERQQLEERLRQAQKMEAIGKLSSGVAHNFNNMLMIVIGDLELALQNASESQRPGLIEAMSAAERAAGIVEQLMFFGQRSSADQYSRIDVQTLLEDTVRICRKTFDRRIQIAFSPPEHPLAITGNASQLQQAFLNLCLNARDALEETDSDNLRVEITVEEISHEEAVKTHAEARPGEYLRAIFSDNGIGMNSEVQERVFEPFFTTKEMGKGTGLGLATAYAVIQQHEGWITCESHLGKGTRFTVCLPTACLAEASVPNDEIESAVSGGTETLLVIDDEDAIRNTVATQLTSYGYKVLQGSDGTDGLEVFRRSRDEIALILLDLSMPKMSGYEFLPIVRGLDPEIRVVLVTGYSVDESQTIDVHAIVQKPYKFTNLARTVREVLDA